MAAHERYVGSIDKSYFNSENKNSIKKMSNYLRMGITYYKKNNQKIKIFNIGTPKSKGDSLAPIVGSKLLEYNLDVEIIGDLNNPVHAKNIEEKIRDNISENDFVIAVDACLGVLNHIGYITIAQGQMSPGTGVNKQLPNIGDISIAGITNVDSGNKEINFFNLYNSDLFMIDKMAEIIAESLYNAITEVKNPLLNEANQLAEKVFA